MAVFSKPKEYRVIAISTSKGSDFSKKDEFEQVTDEFVKYMGKETTDIKQNYAELKDNIQVVKDNQHKLESQMRERLSELNKA